MQRAEEQFACEVLQRVLGCTFTAFDDNAPTAEHEEPIDVSWHVLGAAVDRVIGDVKDQRAAASVHRIIVACDCDPTPPQLSNSAI